MKITAKDYIQARDKLADLEEGISLFRNRATREEMAFDAKIKERIRLLEEEFHSARTRIIDARDKMKAPLVEEKEKAEAYIRKAKEILHHLSLQGTIEETSLTEPHPDFYNTEIEAEGEYYKDDYTWIRYFIVKNRKPKNCYTLLIAGRSRLWKLFSEGSRSRLLYDYGLPNTKDDYTIWIGIKDLPSVKELVAYKSKYDKTSRLQEYFRVRDEYLENVTNYSLKDFEELKVIRDVPEADAPIIFDIKGHEKISTFRLYKGFYYASVEGKAEDKDKLEYLKISGELYLRGGRAEGYTIKQTGNLVFGDWWSFGFEAGGYGVPFNKENWEKELAEATAFVNETRRDKGSKTSFTPPQITWIHPELIPAIPSFF